MSVLLRVENLTKRYVDAQRRNVLAVDGVSFELAQGEVLGVVGESGCGKTTLGRMIVRLLEPTAGRILIEGEDFATLRGAALKQARRNVQMVFQDPFSSLNPRHRVGHILAEPLIVHGVTDRAGIGRRVDELLSMVGLPAGSVERYPHEFSGGQRQRIGIARALALNPGLIICDEPVSALDVSVQAQVINLLGDLQKEFGLSYLFIAHDIAVVEHISHRIAVMYLGKIVEIADKPSLFAEPRHPYTQALLAAIPWPDPTIKRQRVILQGDVPSPLNPPSGCRFHTRCPYAQDKCRTEEPVLAADASGRATACHFWPQIAPNRTGAVLPAPPDARLERLQAYFADRRAEGSRPPAVH